MTDNDRRKLWKAHWLARERVLAAWRERGYADPKPQETPFPAELSGLTCGAKTRAGTPCKLTNIRDNGRCKFHGGMSTGPRTPDGKAKAALNGHAVKRSL